MKHNKHNTSQQWWWYHRPSRRATRTRAHNAQCEPLLQTKQKERNEATRQRSYQLVVDIIGKRQLTIAVRRRNVAKRVTSCILANKLQGWKEIACVARVGAEHVDAKVVVGGGGQRGDIVGVQVHEEFGGVVRRRRSEGDDG